MHIPASLPVRVIAISYWAGAGFFCIFWRGTWAPRARPVVRLLVTGAAVFTALWLLLGAGRADEAARFERVLLPLELVWVAGMGEVAFGLRDARVPRWYRWIWAGVCAGAAIGWFVPWNAAMGRSPGGEFIRLLHPGPVADGLRAVAWIGGAVVVGAMVQAMGRSRRAVVVAAAGMVAGLSGLYDVLWAPFHRGPYPLGWIGGLILAVAVALQARREAIRAELRLTRDLMTGALNRQTGLEYGAEQIAGRRVAVVFVDLDGFKTVNDTLGHAAGDRLLARVGAEMLALCGPDDRLVRLGGDEFLLIFPGADASQASLVRKRVEGALARIHMDPNGRPLRASLGVAAGEAGHAFTEVVDSADRAMYRAKLEARETLRR